MLEVVPAYYYHLLFWLFNLLGLHRLRLHLHPLLLFLCLFESSFSWRQLLPAPASIKAVKVQFRLIIGCPWLQTSSEVHFFEPVIAVKHLLFVFFAVDQQAFSAIEPHSVVGERPHGLHHVGVRAEVEKEPAFGVDEVDGHVAGNKPEP